MLEENEKKLELFSFLLAFYVLNATKASSQLRSKATTKATKSVAASALSNRRK